MGALPKRKISKGRRNRRRSHDKLKEVQFSICQYCKSKKISHGVCKNCGKYNKKEIIKTK